MGPTSGHFPGPGRGQNAPRPHLSVLRTRPPCWRGEGSWSACRRGSETAQPDPPSEDAVWAPRPHPWKPPCAEPALPMLTSLGGRGERLAQGRPGLGQGPAGSASGCGSVTRIPAPSHSHGVKTPDKAALIPVVLGDNGRALCPDKGWTKAACSVPGPSPQPAALPGLGGMQRAQSAETGPCSPWPARAAAARCVCALWGRRVGTQERRPSRSAGLVGGRVRISCERKHRLGVTEWTQGRSQSCPDLSCQEGGVPGQNPGDGGLCPQHPTPSPFPRGWRHRADPWELARPRSLTSSLPPSSFPGHWAAGPSALA